MGSVMETSSKNATPGWLQPVADAIGPAMPSLLMLASILLVFWLTRNVWKRIWSALEGNFLSNWRLVLLGSAALVLSMASGWTTWDGMRNFTREPLLSGMITFGIQGVMLIAAWLIGESFATGMHSRSNRNVLGLGGVLGGLLAAFALIGGIIAIILSEDLPIDSGHILVAIVVLAVIVLVALLQGDLIRPYIQGAKIIVRNAILWVMFLACMGTSVFFAFDSRFSVIFPQEERARASELRAQNEVAGIVADIGRTLTERREEEIRVLFGSEEWAAYEGQLDALAQKAQGAQSAIEAYFVEQMESRRRAIAGQQERRASAESQQAGLQARNIQLNEELSQIQAERPSVMTTVIEQQQVVSEIERRLDEQRARLLAEEKGVEGSGKVGRGQMWRAEKAALDRITAELQVANERLRTPQARLKEIDKRIASIKAELSQIEGNLAQLKGEAATAEQRIAAAERTTGIEESALNIDPAHVLPAFERAKVAFRQEPTIERLADLQRQCAQLLSAMAAAPATKDDIGSIDCDPKRASDAASTLFALNAGAKMFAQNCVGGDKLEQFRSTDRLFDFARGCLADSQLPSESTDELRTRINFAELNRDDKAHNFVVSWNAFHDGNRLAYLALANAIAIDLLVLMTGLFGANALRSPLQDVPSQKPRSAKQLEAIIENALVPDTYETAQAVIQAMQPITPENGFTQEVMLDETEAVDRARVLKVLNAGATIGAVEQDSARAHRYLVRPELFEFLSIVGRRQYEHNEEHRRLAELKQLVLVALQPRVGPNAAIVLHNLHPINEVDGFSSEVLLNQIRPDHEPIVRRLLNAASVLRYVSQDTRANERDRFYIHKDLYKTIARISAQYPAEDSWFEGGGVAQVSPEDTATYLRSYAHDNRGSGGRAQRKPAEAPLSMEEASELYRTYEGRLLNAVGLADVDLVVERLNAPNVRTAAIDAWKALNRQGASNPRLHQLIDSFQRERNAALTEEYNRLRSEIGGSGQRNDILDTAEGRISEVFPNLMMFPEMGLLSSIIEQLEAPAAYDEGLTEDEQVLLERLRNVECLIGDLDLDDVEAWQRVEQVWLRFDADDTPELLNGKRRKTDDGSGDLT